MFPYFTDMLTISAGTASKCDYLGERLYQKRMFAIVPINIQLILYCMPIQYWILKTGGSN